MDGELDTLTATDEYSVVYNTLRTAENSVVELRFNGDYVVRAVELDRDQFYPAVDGSLNDRIGGEDVYEVTLDADTSELRLQGRTLYVLADRDDRGLTFVSDAKAVVIQDEDRNSGVISEYDSVSAALSALAEPDDEEDTPGQQYDGQITAILNSQGVAEWIVFNNYSDLTSNSGAGTSSGRYTSTVDYRTSSVSVVYRRPTSGADPTENGVRASVSDALAAQNYVVTSWGDTTIRFGSETGRDIIVSDSQGRIQEFNVKMEIQ